MINHYPAWKYAPMAVALPVGAVCAPPDPTPPPHPFPDVR